MFAQIADERLFERLNNIFEHINKERCMWKRIYSLLAVLLVFCVTPASFAAVDEFQATLTDFEGEVLFQKSGDKTWFPVEAGMPLESGDKIKTGADGSAEILIDDGSILKLEDKAEIELTAMRADSATKKMKTRLYLGVGRLFSNIAKLMNRESRFDVQTPTAIVGIRGTEFVVELADSEETDVGVFAGSVYVNAVDDEGNLIKEDEVVVTDGNQTTVQRRKRPLPPFALKERMLKHKKKVEFLRQRAIERRRDLKRIIEKREKVREIILQKLKNIKQEKIHRAAELKEHQEQKRIPQAAKLKELQEKKRIPQALKPRGQQEKKQITPLRKKPLEE